jgi:hypothetical protein
VLRPLGSSRVRGAGASRGAAAGAGAGHAVCYEFARNFPQCDPLAVLCGCSQGVVFWTFVARGICHHAVGASPARSPPSLAARRHRRVQGRAAKKCDRGVHHSSMRGLMQVHGVQRGHSACGRLASRAVYVYNY